MNRSDRTRYRTRMSRATAGLAVALAVLSITTAGPVNAAPAEAPLTVTVDSGRLHGTVAGSTRQFLGVPYAKPPVGELRWTPPQPVAHWSGVREATAAGNPCPQQGALPGNLPPINEDCLFLNVTTPRSERPGARLPVMVWWHGGGYTTGAGSPYDAQRLADQGDVIVVTVNYRLGIFGYYGLPGLAGSGNFGFADQIAGLKWAKRNAAAFGGDPRNVTIFGESAGGMSVCAMLTSPQAPGLVDKAAISSGSCRLDWPDGGLFPGTPAQTPYISLAQDQADGTSKAASLGCTTEVLRCMRGKPMAELLPSTVDFSDHLAYGTSLLPRYPADALRDGRFARIPVISGGNADEARSFVGGAIVADPSSVTAQSYPKLIQQAFGDQAGKVAARYPLSAYPSAALAWSTVITDGAWACPTATADRQLAAHTTVYPYEFADPNAPNVNGINLPELPQGAAHATDLPTFFDLGGVNLLKTPPQQELAASMIGYWTRFAWTGNPNRPGAPHWARATRIGTAALQFVPGAIQPVDFAAEHQCGLWDSLG
ncbi:para-nitrobenzyl esterase [Amycolatopsis saalfeldensis]|uniref:Carboxylic ester hydrolase n=2 Tax=Amycolatopsis saalfeldensis TaxID=394193 RepID=A0A1H8YLT6_9PSEU|nr:para-nitrobenzyl esterase [Amycolatopsis saalfeldensis]